MARLRRPGAARPPGRPAIEPRLDAPRAAAPACRAAPRLPRRVGWLPLLALVASLLMHVGVMAALLFWPVTDPVEEPGEIGSVALVFDDTVAEASGGATEAAPPAPPAPPPVAPPPPAPVAEAPPPPVPAAPPPPPEAPRDLAALPPDPAGILPPPPAEAAPAPPREAEPQPEVPQAEAAPDPLPLPPPPPPAPQQQAAVQPPPQPQPRPQPRPPATQGPVRLDAGAGDMAEPSSLGSFALGAVVPPGNDAGHRNTPPDYPAESRRRGEEGVVRLTLRIAPDGQVTEAEVEASSGFPALDRAAIEAARRWRFRPATRAGLPVAATLPTAVHFRLSDARGR